LSESFLRDQDFTRRGSALESRRDIDRIAKHGVVGHVFAADVADERLAGTESAPTSGRWSSGMAATSRKISRALVTARRAWSCQWRGEECHHFVADELVERAVVTKDRVGGDVIETIETRGDFGGIHLFRSAAKPRMSTNRTEMFLVSPPGGASSYQSVQR